MPATSRRWVSSSIRPPPGRCSSVTPAAEPPAATTRTPPSAPCSKKLARGEKRALLALATGSGKTFIAVHLLKKIAEADRQITADNLRHFGEPVYEYDMAQGIEDGYLAACEIHRLDVFLDDKDEKTVGIARNDLVGEKLTDAFTGEVVYPDEARPHYFGQDMEDKLVSPERVAVMCRELFERLLATGGPEQKTIIFCARDHHANRVAAQMNNFYAEWCAAQRRRRCCGRRFGGSCEVVGRVGLVRRGWLC